MNQLTVGTIDSLIEASSSDDSLVADLTEIRFIDPYALLLLRLLILEREEREVPLSVRWPRASQVLRWICSMGINADAGECSSSSLRDPESALQPITRIDDESEVGRVVDGFHCRLSERYPLTSSSRRTLIAVMIELFQNVPHHSNATGSIRDPHGVAAMQDYEDSIFLAVADKGVGLSSSLGLREGYEGLSDAGALDVVLHQGASRFNDPGRGGELRRIADLVRSWDGTFALRTGNALYHCDPLGGDTYDVPHFPGVQLALRLPRSALS